MNDLVFVMCNTKLEANQTRKQIDVEDMSSDDEWILDTNGDEACSSSVGDLDVDGGNNEEDNFSFEENWNDGRIGFGNDDAFDDEGNEEFEEDAANDDEF